MNVIKSALVLIFLLVLIIFSAYLIRKCIHKYRTGFLTAYQFVLSLCVCIITCINLVLFYDYTNPFERELEPVLVAEFDVPHGYELEYPGEKFWHGAYEQFGLYAESFYFDPDSRRSEYGFDWPPMNFDRYCYIITYGQKIESLTYNVWDTIDIPIRTGAKVGHMILDSVFCPSKVYVYQIPKIRIENDVNNINRQWD